jgi:hypothetical protein
MYQLPYFGEIAPSTLENYYDAEIDFNGHKIQLDLNFDNQSIDIKLLDIVKQFLENISLYDHKNKKYIKSDYEDDNGDTVRTYIEHHLEEIEKEELADIVDFSNKLKSPEIQLMETLHLVRLGLYPDSEDMFAIFDYSIEPELTPYLVVINTDSKGKLDYMTMES